MSFYDANILPHLIKFACGLKPIRKQREKVVPLAEGRVLEVGMGSGLNLPFYTDKVDELLGLEPCEKARLMTKKSIERTGRAVNFIGLDGQDIPLEAKSVDTVVLTYALCTIPDAAKAVSEMRRVLKPGGRLLFSEHGKAPDAAVEKWQNRINPAWSHMFGGCNLNREIMDLIRAGGFKIVEHDEMYVPGPKFASYTYWGSAE